MWRTGHARPQEMEENSADESFDVESFGEPNSAADLLLFASIDSYAAVQRTSTLRPLPCDCTELLSVTSTDMASTTYVGPATAPYPHIYYPIAPERSSSPDDDIDSSPNNDTDHTDEESDHTLSEDDRSLSSVSTQIIYPRDEITPIRLKRASRALRPGYITRKKKMTLTEPPLHKRGRPGAHRMAVAARLNNQVANRIIKYARCVRNVYERDMGCLTCGLLPLCPTTGQCGHTRCTDCVVDQIRCPCGYEAPNELSVNILIRDLVGKTTSESSRIVPVPASVNVNTEDIDVASADSATIKSQPMSGAGGSSRGRMRLAGISARARIPMSPRARYNRGLELLGVGEHLEAVPYLAFAAASGQPELRRARALLTLTINVLRNNGDPQRLATQLIRSVRRLSPTSRIRPTDMECILCCDTFTNPVTTPCGHMFCRTCLEKTLDYGKRCPLCLRDLLDFTLSKTGITLFVQAALKSINVIVTPPPPLEPGLIHIFVCTVAYPTVPCPLFIFDPRYWLMIRRVLESGSRRFGMVAFNRGQDYVEYGTILEVRDCVHFEDGKSILSTIGLSRFKIIERVVRDGCDVARIMPITDVIPRVNNYEWEIKVLAHRIMFKALTWMSRLTTKVLTDIEAAFGILQKDGFFDGFWWQTNDGPPWLWWLVAVLPLRSEIKILILSTTSLTKRMMAVTRVLNAIIQ